MNLSFTDEQNLLLQSAQRYLAEQYNFTERQRIVVSPGGWDPSKWQSFAQLGWLALPFAPDHGGLGGDAVDLHLLAQAFGQALVVEPYLSTVVLCGSLTASIATPLHREAMLAQIAAGELRVALAYEEPSNRLAPMAAADAPLPMKTRAVANSNGWQLSGTKTNVLAAASAQMWIVAAQIGATSDGEPERGALFLVQPDAHGVRQRPHSLIDGQRSATIEFDAVRVAAVDRFDDPQASALACHGAIQQACDKAMIFAASQASGSMQALLDATLAYVKTRVQFGQPLSANQVIRHRLVDMAIACEEARAIALRAAIVLADRAPEPDNTQAVALSSAAGAAVAAAAAAARIKVARCARYVAEQAVQLHGGMGVTEELNIGAYFKSLLAFELRFGANEQVQRAQFARLRQRLAIETASEAASESAIESRGETTFVASDHESGERRHGAAL